MNEQRFMTDFESARQQSIEAELPYVPNLPIDNSGVIFISMLLAFVWFLQLIMPALINSREPEICRVPSEEAGQNVIACVKEVFDAPEIKTDTFDWNSTISSWEVTDGYIVYANDGSWDIGDYVEAADTQYAEAFKIVPYQQAVVVEELEDATTFVAFPTASQPVYQPESEYALFPALQFTREWKKYLLDPYTEQEQ